LNHFIKEERQPVLLKKEEKREGSPGEYLLTRKRFKAPGNKAVIKK